MMKSKVFKMMFAATFAVSEVLAMDDIPQCSEDAKKKGWSKRIHKAIDDRDGGGLAQVALEFEVINNLNSQFNKFENDFNFYGLNLL